MNYFKLGVPMSKFLIQTRNSINGFVFELMEDGIGERHILVQSTSKILVQEAFAKALSRIDSRYFKRTNLGCTSDGSLCAMYETTNEIIK